jgi:hypothetical protein
MCHESNRKGSEVSAEDVDFPKGKWVQIAAVYSGKTVKLYQDRELVLEYELDTVDLLSSIAANPEYCYIMYLRYVIIALVLRLD